MNRLRLGMSTYSFWHFTPEKTPIDYVLDRAAEYGVDGVEILQRQLPDTNPDTLRQIKRKALTLGLDLYALSIHQSFVSPDPEVLQKHIDHTIDCIRQAALLGAPAIRINSGRWGTLKGFDALMEVEGKEPPLPGYTEDDAFGWVISCLERVLPTAEEYGVVLALENHWGLTSTAEGVNRILGAIKSPWLAGAMDCGNFRVDTYNELKKIAPHAIFVHAKTYQGGGVWYSLDLDYKKIAQILRDVNFQGYVSLEYEGNADPTKAVPESLNMLREAFQG